MRKHWSSMVGGWAVCLLAGCLAALSPAVNAQVFRSHRIQGGVGISGGGQSGQFFQHAEGAGPERGIVIMIGGPGGAVDIGASLLKACDSNQDGSATPDEVKLGLLTWFRQADTDTNGALSELELATVLEKSFPVPPPPPGLPPIPEESALHTLLAKKVMATVDADKDGWLVFKEAVAFVGQNFSQWDANSNGSLDASEFAAAFVPLMPEPTGGVFGQERR